MILSIVTINRNNASGLRNTMRSVLGQGYSNFEFVVVDGASTDGSVDVINEYASAFGGRLKWISEPDNGIYNAMNKGLSMASGEYVEFLNSGDCLIAADVTERMVQSLDANGHPPILYGNMVKSFPDGKRLRDLCFAGKEISLLGFYTGTLNHSPAYIRKELFDRFGLYDESLRIVSDWKWYLQVIVLGGVQPVYANIDVTLFDMTGISETNKDLEKAERGKVLEELVPQAVISDYSRYSFAIEQYKRLNRHPWSYKVMWFIERVLFKFEKLEMKRAKTVEYR